MCVRLVRFMITIFVYFIIYPKIYLSDLVIKEDNFPSLDKFRLKNKDDRSNNLIENKTLENPDLYKKSHEISAKRPKLQLTEEEMEKLKIWPRGVIPYYIDDFSFDKVLRDRIRSFLVETTEKTGLQFVEMPSPPNNNVTRWVFFINRRGLLKCADYNNIVNFTNKGVQRVILGYDCLGAGGGGTLAATVLALAGVPPQHNAPDRDEYIQIIYDNIIPETFELFSILPDELWPFKEHFDYDFASAGHYDFYKHTKNGKMTIKPLYKVPTSIGDTKGLSRIDILKIKFLYEYISQKPKPNISEDCSKMYKLGKKLNSHNKNNGSLDDDSSYLKHAIKRPKFKRGLKAKIEKEMDFDTDLGA